MRATPPETALRGGRGLSARRRVRRPWPSRSRSSGRTEFPPHARTRRPMRPLRLAVDAGVVDEDTRGIGRYARALLRRIAVRDDVELLLLRRGPLAFRHRARLESALESDRFRIRSDAPAQYAD